MSCHRYGPAAFIAQIEARTDLKVTQADWHAVRQLAKADGADMSRRPAADEAVQQAASDLGDSLGVRLPGRVAATTRQTTGTISTIQYLATHGVEATIGRVRVAAAWDRDLQVHLMPIVRLANSDRVSYEALARWEREGVTIGPAEAFSNGADPESTSKIALVQAVSLAGSEGKPVSVNLSAHLISDPTVLQSAAETCDNLGVDRSLLSVELLENEPLSDPELLGRFSEWRSAGFQIALDDFGSGYANAEVARALRPNVIKTDMSLIQNREIASIMEAVRVADEIGATVTVEGIETAEQAQLARLAGALWGQGWYFGKAAAPAK